VYFGLVSTVRPATLNDQGFWNSASEVLTSAAPCRLRVALEQLEDLLRAAEGSNLEAARRAA